MNPKTLALIEAARAKHAALIAARQAAMQPPTEGNGDGNESSNESSNKPSNDPINLHLSSTSKHAQSVLSNLTFNEDQQAAIELGLQGKSFCLIGAAGTGKTTTTQELISRIQRAAHMRPLVEGTKHLVKDNPAIVICGYTNKAVNNIRKKLPANLQAHCITIHKLLEYQPNYYEVTNDEGFTHTTMRFEPAKNAANPLPHISTIIFEESSMIGTDLYGEVIAALPRASATQIIFLGDLNQIPPVFGPSILGFKLAELQTVELKTVYRQALESPIISLATAIRTNNSSGYNEGSVAWESLAGNLLQTIKQDNGEHGNVTLHPWKKRIDKESALVVMNSFLPRIIASGEYNPEEDMILCPFNKSFGTIELNNIIADYLAKKRNAVVFEVIARYQRSYWAVGDRVLVDRHEAVITKIDKTIGYGGKLPVAESRTLDRWGNDPNNDETKTQLTADQILSELDRLAGSGTDEEAKNLASHNITVHIPDLGIDKTLTSAGEINSMLFGYCLTIHKSQGSEWQNVFLFLHDSHATMISRELIYTAVTRAKHKLYIICEGDNKGKRNSLKRAAERPIIPGTTLQEKIAFFAEKAKSLKSIASNDDME
jgi:ATP-dependent exoDNAse (exonuclease V) alpha subunit